MMAYAADYTFPASDGWQRDPITGDIWRHTPVQTSDDIPPADPHAGHHARIIRAIAELEAAVEQAKQVGVALVGYPETIRKIAAGIGS